MRRKRRRRTNCRMVGVGRVPSFPRLHLLIVWMSVALGKAGHHAPSLLSNVFLLSSFSEQPVELCHASVFVRWLENLISDKNCKICKYSTVSLFYTQWPQLSIIFTLGYNCLLSHISKKRRKELAILALPGSIRGDLIIKILSSSGNGEKLPSKAFNYLLLMMIIKMVLWWCQPWWRIIE